MSCQSPRTLNGSRVKRPSIECNLWSTPMIRHAVGPGVLAVFLATVGCSSAPASTSVSPSLVLPVSSDVSPPPAPPVSVDGVTQSTCVYALGSKSLAIEHAGGAGSVGVTTGTGCGWTATSNAPFITVTAGAAGTGNGTVTFAVAANLGSVRTGTLAIAGEVFTVTQDDTSSCTYSISPTSVNGFYPGSGNLSVKVTTADGCPWTATSNAPWMGLNSLPCCSNGVGVGTGNVSIFVTRNLPDAVNTGGVRTGTLTIAGHTFPVTQHAWCVFKDPAPPGSVVLEFDASGGTGSVHVTTNEGCQWNAVPIAPWISMRDADGQVLNWPQTRRTGSGTVFFAIAPNTTGADRDGSISFALNWTENGYPGWVRIHQRGQ